MEETLLTPPLGKGGGGDFHASQVPDKSRGN